jgi:hypothetical protein
MSARACTLLQNYLLQRVIKDKARVVVVQRDVPLVPVPFTATGRAVNAAKVNQTVDMCPGLSPHVITDDLVPLWSSRCPGGSVRVTERRVAEDEGRCGHGAARCVEASSLGLPVRVSEPCGGSPAVTDPVALPLLHLAVSSLFQASVSPSTSLDTVDEEMNDQVLSRPRQCS